MAIKKTAIMLASILFAFCSNLSLHAKEILKEKKAIRTIEDEIKVNKEEPKVLHIIPWKDDVDTYPLASDFAPRSFNNLPKKTEEYDLVKSFPAD